MYDNGGGTILMVSIIVIAFLVLFVGRAIVWWWLGIGDQINEAKRTNELLTQLIALQQTQQQPQPPQDGPVPRPQSPPLRNPLTQRP